MLFDPQEERSRHNLEGEGDDYKALVNDDDGVEWSSVPGIEAVQGEPQASRNRQCCLPWPSDETRQRYAEFTGASRVIVTVLLFMTISGAFYVNDIVQASMNIEIPDPNSPSTEELLIPVDSLSVRRDDMDLILPLPPTVASLGYMDAVVSWDTCSSWNKICRVLKRDGEVWLVCCFAGICLSLLATVTQVFYSSWLTSRWLKIVMRVMSFFCLMNIVALLSVWWLDAYPSIGSTTLAIFPIASPETGETNILTMNFTDVRIFPGYSLVLISTAGILHIIDFILTIFL